MINKEVSYTAASAIPVKILLDDDLLYNIKKYKRIIPIHVQLNPTNVCNLNCKFCSCSERDRNLELPYIKICDIMRKFRDLGCKAVTITGGGEPLLHPKINEIIKFIAKIGIKVGLVSNGIEIKRLKQDTLNKITWIRISLGDDRVVTNEFWKNLEDVVYLGRKVDWSFSYVLTDKPNFRLIEQMIAFANENRFTHIRIVNDIFNADKISIDPVKNYIKQRKINDSLVIYQDRGTWTSGSKKCWISLLKPVVGADGYIYPCCGTQYALANPSRDYEKTMRMGKVEDIKKIINEQKCFNGSVCVKCYYHNYNYILDALLSDIKHGEFV
jgi:MoaA/NifB/PqqE/SkfB family radical SAM enzyme